MPYLEPACLPRNVELSIQKALRESLAGMPQFPTWLETDMKNICWDEPDWKLATPESGEQKNFLFKYWMKLKWLDAKMTRHGLFHLNIELYTLIKHDPRQHVLKLMEGDVISAMNNIPDGLIYNFGNELELPKNEELVATDACFVSQGTMKSETKEEDDAEIKKLKHEVSGFDLKYEFDTDRRGSFIR